MDNVSCLKFNFKLLRHPRIKTSNIFAYAASVTIFSDNEVFLYVEDICIIDFIYKLSLYNDVACFLIIPIDSSTKILVIRKIKDDIVEISSEWTKQIIKVNFYQLLESIKNLKTSFEKTAKVCINDYFKAEF